MEWYLKVVRDNYANFSGRARRKEYWMFALFNTIFAFILIIIDNSMVLYYIYLLAIIIPSIAVGIRRLHDLDKSGWWFLINMIPIIGAIWFFILLCLDGTQGPNKYGPSPKYDVDHAVQPDYQVNPEPVQEVLLNEPPAPTVVETDEPEVQSDLIPITLNIENGSRAGSFFPVSSKMRLGRAPDNDIILNAKTVSSYHAEIIIKNNLYYIKDLDSTNGTKINDERISGETVLDSGSSLQIGEIKMSVKKV